MPNPNDPTSPDYAPTGGGGGGPDYGGGAQFGADTYALYSAGQVYMPEAASKFADAGQELLWVSAEISSMGGAIGHSAFSTVQGKVDVVLDAMGLTATRIYEAAEAMVQIADSFVTSDEGAATEFNNLKRDNQALFDSRPPLTDAPRSGDPVPQGPRVTPGGDIDDLLEGTDIPNTLDEDGDGELDTPTDEED